MSETAVTSFIIRFIQDDARDAPWRGLIRHVQSSEEAHFTGIEDALTFMARFVDISVLPENPSISLLPPHQTEAQTNANE